MHLLSEFYEYNYYSKHLEISDIPETIFWVPRSTLHLCTGLSHSSWWISLEGDGCTGTVADGGHWSSHTLCGDPVVHLCSTVQEMGEGNSIFPFTLPIIIAAYSHSVLASLYTPSTYHSVFLSPLPLSISLSLTFPHSSTCHAVPHPLLSLRTQSLSSMGLAVASHRSLGTTLSLPLASILRHSTNLCCEPVPQVVSVHDLHSLLTHL